MNNLAIVFDLDETIGSFSQLSIIWKVLNKIEILTNNSELGQIQFNKLLNHFNKILRPNILQSFKYLLQNKNSNDKIVLYTNNQVGKRWVIMIKNYLEHVLDNSLFDFIIFAYLINGKIVDPLRTTINKTQNDLLRCTNLPISTRICFIDDKYYPNLGESKQVYYIKLEAYKYKLPWKIMLEEIDQLNIIKKSVISLEQTLNNKFEINKEEQIYINQNFLKKIIFFWKKNKNKTLKYKIFHQKSRKVKL